MSQSEFYRGFEGAQQRLRSKPAAAPAARAAAVGEFVDEQSRERSRNGDWACRAGCAHCCRHPVGVTFAEAERLVRALLELPRAVEERVSAAARKTRELSWSALAEQSCPLLGNGQRCLVYDARPIPCRAWGSSNREACAEPGRHGGVPFDRIMFQRGLGASAALAEGALADEAQHRELRSALALMLGALDPRRAFEQARASGG